MTEGSTNSESHVVDAVCVRWFSSDDVCSQATEVSDSLRQHESPILPRAVPEWQSPGRTGG